jgi:hypothetical protein
VPLEGASSASGESKLRYTHLGLDWRNGVVRGDVVLAAWGYAGEPSVFDTVDAAKFMLAGNPPEQLGQALDALLGKLADELGL